MKAHPYQKKVAHYLLVKQKNVIIQAPTGAGKFYASLLPFLNAVTHQRDFPRKCIYAVPMRVLATQFYDIADSAIKQMGLQDKISVKIQTGESQNDKEFSGNLIFATIDQVLSSFLISPYSLSHRKANLNAGAILSSYLVFDEFHLFDPNSTLPTTLHMLKMLKGITPFVLMTATFSRTMLKELATELDAEIVGLSDEERTEFAKLPSQKKERFYHTVDAVLTADAVLKKHDDIESDRPKRSLVICNTVDRARKIYEAINVGKSSETEVILLHSRFLSDDRRAREESIRTKFGQKSAQKTEGDFIVVSTQAIEVGVDMTSTVLHTELAPANSIIQRAGRCARYEGEKGNIYIYGRALDKDNEEISLCENVMPYEGQKEVIINTWKAFSELDGQILKFDDEQDVLSFAHGGQDRQIIADLRATNRNHREKLYAVMRGDKGENAKSLIREVMSQQVTIHDNPDEVLKNPFAYPSFGLHPGTVQGHLKDWIDRRNHKSQIAIIEEKEDKNSEDVAQANEERYEARAVEEHEKEGFMAKLLVIHPDLATYNEEVGFIAERGGKWQAEIDPKANNERSKPDIRYRLETYEQHIELVYQAFTEYWKEAEWAAKKLEERFKWETGSVYKAAQLAVLLHDVGKLSKGWQDWVRKYQKAIDMPVEDGFAYAHTQLQNDFHRKVEKEMGRRPWHAVESALSVIPVLKKEIGITAIVKATYSAIARHHTAHSYLNEEFELIDDAIQFVQRAVEYNNLSIPITKLNPRSIREKDLRGQNVILLNDSPSEEQIACYLAYLLIVRVLRRADSTGTQRGSIGG